MKKSLAYVIAFMAISTNGFAGERPQAFSASPFVGGYTFDGTQHLKTGPVFGLRLGYNITENWATEGVFDFVPTETTRGNNHINAYSYRLDLLYNFMPTRTVVPYLAVGGGGTTFEYRHGNGHDSDATFNFGGGVKYFITESIALRGDVRQLLAFEDKTQFNWEYTAGMTFLFGGKKAASSPPITRTESEAAPVTRQEPTAPPPRTFEAQPEAQLGPIPATEPSPERMKYCVSLDIEFDINKADIRPQYRDEVAKVGDFMKKHPTTTALIEGYTDEVGTDEDSLLLSQQRAESVVKTLEEDFGIEPGRLSAKGYGKAKPSAVNSTDIGRQKNRRIDAIIDCALDVKDLATPPERLCMTLKMEFASGAADINPIYNDQVNKVGEYMKKYPSTTAVIEGHTDNVGGLESNRELSRQRAESVVTYLVANFGIERNRLSAKGYGPTRRIAYNTTAEGRQKNRRINAVIDCVIRK
jgi:OOP family OmpA-OmpF porin